MHEDLLSVARQLAQLDHGRPRQATLRRSVSTAYYALFHALCDTCVKQTVGWKRRVDFWAPISPIYRAIDHGSARRLFLTLRSSRHAVGQLKRLADLFVELQDARLRADYDPATRLTRGQAIEYTSDAEEAIRMLDGLNSEMQLQLVVQLLTKTR